MPVRRRLTVGPIALALAALLGAWRGAAPASAPAAEAEPGSGKEAATRSPFKHDSFAAPRPVEVTYDGVLDLEAHFRRPGEMRAYLARRRFLMDARGAGRLDWTTWSAGDSMGEPESFRAVQGLAAASVSKDKHITAGETLAFIFPMTSEGPVVTGNLPLAGDLPEGYLRSAQRVPQKLCN